MKLSNYAVDCSRSKGRLYAEDQEWASMEGCDRFHIDRGRIMQSSAFRKLAHKTQAFLNNEDDYYRNRLTHSLEAAHIARSICYRLELNQNLSEAIALAHDIGHAPFGHAGEDGLQEVLSFSSVNFEHNLQALRIVVELEQRYSHCRGLNLSWEVIEGLAKHNGPVSGRDINSTLREYDLIYNLDLASYPTLEAQVASAADDIAFNNHDIDDALRSGIVGLEAIFELPFIGSHFRKAKGLHPKANNKILISEALRSVMEHMIYDVVQHTKQNIKSLGIKNSQDVRTCNQQIVDFSESAKEYNNAIRSFLTDNLYNNYYMHRAGVQGKRMVRELFENFYEDTMLLPTEWYRMTCEVPEERKIAVICDYIAGMTDRFAVHEYHRIKGNFYEIFRR